MQLKARHNRIRNNPPRKVTNELARKAYHILTSSQFLSPGQRSVPLYNEKFSILKYGYAFEGHLWILYNLNIDKKKFAMAQKFDDSFFINEKYFEKFKDPNLF